MSIALVKPSSHLILWCPLLLCPQSFPASGTFPMNQLFASGDQNTGASAFSNSPSNKYSGLIFFKIDWFHLLAVQGTLRSLLYYQSLKASVLQCSAFFTVQLSQPYMTTGKTIAFTIWNFFRRVIFLLFNTLSRFVIVFLPRSNRLLISCLQSPSAAILEPKKSKFVTASTFTPICLEVMGPNAKIIDF